MRTATIEIYQFNELSDDAKETARAWYRDGIQYDEWWDFTFECAKEIGKLIGINIDDIYFSGFSSQGDGACFVGDYSYQKWSVKKIREYAPSDKDLLDIAENLASVQRRYFYQLTASVTHTGHYNHEYSVTIDVEDSRQDWCENVAKEGGDMIIESLRDFMRWIYERLESEYEYLNSDDVVDKSIQCNEYEFKANGEIY